MATEETLIHAIEIYKANTKNTSLIILLLTKHNPPRQRQVKNKNVCTLHQHCPKY